MVVLHPTPLPYNISRYTEKAVEPLGFETAPLRGVEPSSTR